VYWLASEGLPMLKIYTLAMLIRALDFRRAINCVWNVGRKYVNHMAATEIMMAMAAVLREWINGHARTSRVLGLMIDESTDVRTRRSSCCTCGFVSTVATSRCFGPHCL